MGIRCRFHVPLVACIVACVLLALAPASRGPHMGIRHDQFSFHPVCASSTPPVQPPVLVVQPDLVDGWPVLSWDPVPNATRYVVMFSAVPIISTADVTVSRLVEGTSLILDFLPAGRYHIVAVSMNAYHVSGLSNEVQVDIPMPAMLVGVIVLVAGTVATAVAMVPVAITRRTSATAARRRAALTGTTKPAPLASPKAPATRVKGSRDACLDAPPSRDLPGPLLGDRVLASLYLQRPGSIDEYMQFLDAIKRAWVLSGEDLDPLHVETFGGGSEDMDGEVSDYLAVVERLHLHGLGPRAGDDPRDGDGASIGVQFEHRGAAFLAFARAGVVLVMRCSKGAATGRFARACIERCLDRVIEIAGQGAPLAPGVVSRCLHESFPWWPADSHFFPDGTVTVLRNAATATSDADLGRDLINLAKSLSSMRAGVDDP